MRTARCAGSVPIRLQPMNLISLDIRMLRSLISVVDTGSITETARRLGRTQPAISLQIQRLEDITAKCCSSMKAAGWR